MVYKVQDINKRFTDVVTQYIDEGYVICTSTMNGSQGEIAKVHLIKGNSILNIFLDRETCFKEPFYYATVLTLNVREYKDLELNLTLDNWCTIWNNKGTEISKEEYIKLNESTFALKEDAYEMYQKKLARISNRLSETECTEIKSDEAKKAIISLIQKQPKCKSKTWKDITRIAHYVTTTASYYLIVLANCNSYKFTLTPDIRTLISRR